MRKTLYDDGYHHELTEGAKVVGEDGIVALANMKNTQIPKELVPFNKAKTKKDKRGYVHFYIHDKGFACVLNNAKKYAPLFRQYDGIISPDPSMGIGNSLCLLKMSTYFNRAIGFFYQRNGIPVIPNIRWTDEASYPFCFLGVPKNSIVAISTHGCCKSKEQKELFRAGLIKMLEVLEPEDVIVHGHMPKEIFQGLENKTRFHRYPSEFEQTHKEER